MKTEKQANRQPATDDEFEGVRRLLVIDDEQNMRHMLSVLLKKSGYQVETAADGLEGLAALERQPYDFILCDIKMPNMGGLEFLKAAREKLHGTTVIVMSAYGSIDVAVEAMKLGAYDYISKPFKSDEVHLTLKKAEERESLKKENLLLKERIRKIGRDSRFGNMIGKSKPMQAVFQLAEKVAHYDTTVLITGESGTGKELIARGIHFSGQRSNAPLVPVNCGGIPENLLESELFGYVKGAFTGADKNKKGLFEEAQGGTIFLDEIGELPISLQVKLLRVLQENEIRPVGGSKTRQVDVRVVAATAKNLDEEIGRGNFREDLFYRLNVMPIHIPPLRDRTEDIPLLCQAFIDRFNRSLNRQISDVIPSALSLLMRHSWPGNVRELENAIERAMVFAEGRQLKPDHFPPEIGSGAGADPVSGTTTGYSLKEAQRILEKNLIVKALEETGGNRTRAAKLLEISHPSLLSKIKTYKIDM
jgi:two-component system response regulator AtoC